MEHAWSYVSVGYGVAIVALSTYVIWMLRRTRRLRRGLSRETLAEFEGVLSRLASNVAFDGQSALPWTGLIETKS